MLDIVKRLQYKMAMDILKQADWKSLIMIIALICPLLFGLKLLEKKSIQYSKIYNGAK